MYLTCFTSRLKRAMTILGRNEHNVQTDIMEIINHTLFAMSKDCIHVTGLNLSGKDGIITAIGAANTGMAVYHTLMNSHMPAFNVTIPIETLLQAKKIFKGEKVNLYLVDENAFLIGEKVTLISSLVEKNFPDVMRILDNNFETKVTISKTKLLKVIRSLNIIIKVHIENDICNVIVENKDEDGDYENKKVIKCSQKGPSVTFYLNSSLLAKALELITTDEVRIETLADSKGPIVVYPIGTDDYFYVQMKMLKY